MGIHGGGERKGPRAGGCDGFFPARRASRSGSAAADEAGRVSPGGNTLCYLFGEYEEFSVEHGSGSDADVCRHGARAVGATGDAFAGSDYRARASFVRATAAAGLQAAGV